MYAFWKGQIIDNFINCPEGIRFNIDDSGAILLVFFNNPTKYEIEQFKYNFEIRFTYLYNVIMITTKIGNFNWMDAPYTPHLSKNLTTLQMPKENQGLGLKLILVNSLTGEIKNIRYFGLSTNFTKQLFKTIINCKSENFDIKEYDNTINKIYSKYSTNEIVKMSSNYCKFNQ